MGSVGYLIAVAPPWLTCRTEDMRFVNLHVYIYIYTLTNRVEMDLLTSPYCLNQEGNTQRNC